MEDINHDNFTVETVIVLYCIVLFAHLYFERLPRSANFLLFINTPSLMIKILRISFYPVKKSLAFRLAMIVRQAIDFSNCLGWLPNCTFWYWNQSH